MMTKLSDGFGQRLTVISNGISALGIDPGLITGKAEITRQPHTADKAFAIHIAKHNNVAYDVPL
jgi:hypothetical protein